MGCLIKSIIGFVCILLLAAALVFGGLWAAKKYGPQIVADEFERQTGFRASLGDFEGSASGGYVKLDDLEIRNPQGWPEEEFLDVDRAVLDVQLETLRRESQLAVVDEVVFDVDSINIVTTPEHQNNAALLFSRLGALKDRAQTRPFTIKRLELALESIRIADYNGGGQPRVTVIPVNARLERTDVTEQDLPRVIEDFAREARLQELVQRNPALAKVMVDSALAGEAPNPNSPDFKERIDKAREGIEQQTENVGRMINTLIEKLRDKLAE